MPTNAALQLTELEDREPASDVMERAKAGDSAAFELLYHEHSPRVYSLCLRLMGSDPVAAKTLLQDVFVTAWRALPRFRGDAPLSSWLHRLTVNAMLQTARSDKRRTARVLPMEDPGRLGVAARSATPDLLVDLENAIASLPNGARTAFVLHHVEGFQHQEIAEQLGVAVGTVKAQVHRARSLLMKALDR